MRTLLALPLVACTTVESPFSRVTPQVQVESNPGNVAGRRDFSLALTTWNDLDVLADAIDANEISATLDGAALAIDPSTTGYAYGRDSYTATFERATARSATEPTTTSRIAISDGEITWSVDIANLFANDLALEAPLATGSNTFVWPSAAATGPYSNIDWACIAVGDQAAACGGYDVDVPAIEVSQQFIVASVNAAPSTPVIVTGERNADTDTGDDGPVFFTRIYDRLALTR
jgi:hypothetical protein